ncbi:IS5-like element ISAae1 family transposase [Aquifex aeolicus]|uniref:Uncharacterized protein aq_1391/aq_1640/aq_aa40 n=1 Tax=Aquifex aeolicus (strain VF5) TaxID=224324 RepID=Y1391_AQUAE|nr:IS5-like element ISAae1 family transposase [Aquifex aeolicus]O70075.1 RecName: Full=Uncharacterized protein aq_1391/aq_1640/aq_aa40 [Aquifex aeolicus VF5]AAC07367.1 hypothetical protein aq_1391 [Aquifex aeolicus VF5]AAC07540.1 hypothetical protein aq_1640 [Aquifex aeolicus VF5]AAC07980.1 putative protein [Aquifex aeolicus VF5]
MTQWKRRSRRKGMRTRNNKQLIKLILTKSREICNTIRPSQYNKRGRPRVYEDHLIVAALLIKILENLSLRDLEERLKDLFPKVPDFTTLHYRFRKLNRGYLKELIHRTAKEIMEKLQAKEFYCLIADGTGFGYAQAYELKWKKGKELRNVKSHVKTEVLVGVVRNKAIVVDINTGKSYADENMLLRSMLKELGFRARYFLGDAYYGKSAGVLEEIKKLRMESIVPVRDTAHTRVRNMYRLWAKRNYEIRRKVYRKNRYRVEQVIGIVKNRFGDRDNVYDFEIASLYVLGRFVLYNLILLLKLLLLCLNLLRITWASSRFIL